MNMKLIRVLAFPLTPLYYIVTSLRNRLYDWGIKKSVDFNFPVICVGNLSVGGTGKTPMIEYLIRLLKDDFEIATLSRGYKRKSKGFLMAHGQVKVEDLGDEPYQFYTKFKETITVAVDSDRVNGIKKLKALRPQVHAVLLDDAFQHRRVRAGLNILLTSFDNLYVNDYVLPVGNLREGAKGAGRADIIVITKCPEHLSHEKKESVLKAIDPEGNQQVFFSFIKYANEVHSSKKALTLDDLKNLTLVTGIANASPLVEFLRGRGLEFEHLSYKDHYEFSLKDVKRFESLTTILTTEKDFMRLRKYDALKDKLYYIPIELGIDQHTDFDRAVRRFVSSY